MRPILFEIFGVPLASWYVFFSLAGLAAFYYSKAVLELMNDANTSPSLQSPELQKHSVIFSMGYVAGWFGARGLSILREDFSGNDFGSSFVKLFELGSMTFYGGAFAATCVGIVSAKVFRLRFEQCFTAFVPAGVLALGIGRVGCFLNGDDFGRAVANQIEPPWWAHTSPVLEDGLSRYPTQLQEAFFSILLAIVFFIILRVKMSGETLLKRISFGGLAAVCALFSAGNRFVNEFFRGDPRGQFWGSDLSTSQGIALILMSLSAVYLVVSFLETKKQIQVH
jgi:phosphatidylglycerol---prolipoprotein diacylglyceryl transferase